MDEDNPYASPKDTSTGPGPDVVDDTSLDFGRRRWQSRDFTFAIAQQGIFLGLTALILDGGFLLRLCLATVIGHWIAIALILMRRRATPTKLDVAMVKYGFLFCFFLIVPMLMTVLSLLAASR